MIDDMTPSNAVHTSEILDRFKDSLSNQETVKEEKKYEDKPREYWLEISKTFGSTVWPHIPKAGKVARDSEIIHVIEVVPYHQSGDCSELKDKTP